MGLEPWVLTPDTEWRRECGGRTPNRTAPQAGIPAGRVPQAVPPRAMIPQAIPRAMIPSATVRSASARCCPRTGCPCCPNWPPSSPPPRPARRRNRSAAAPPCSDAACGYGDRRGLPAAPDRVAVGPGAPALLVALTAAIGGDVLVPRPCASWWAPYARLLGRPAFPVPVPAESGGVPDPYALLETVRRLRAEGGDPRLLVLSVADDPTGTVAPPELLHETLEAAVGEGLHLVSDETWRDTLHTPRDTVLLGPADHAARTGHRGHRPGGRPASRRAGPPRSPASRRARRAARSTRACSTS
ncbi:hypothetical protein SHIRM173S_12692 [Streptomyces hirsutus]